MKNPMFRTSFVVAVAAIVVGLAAPSGSAASAPDPLGALTASERALLASDEEKAAVVDAETGAFLSVIRVERASGAQGVAQAGSHSVCSASDICFYSGKIPYADIAFTGKGVAKGSWPARSGYYSAGANVIFCWTTACTPRVSAHTKVSFNGSLVTGTSATLL
ncbi:hypothetical protein ACIOUE_03710 [Streptomyces xanthochromogenes]|uniref:hypothetical protein n=1 Tax=Streptomyces xanthochromogenes TaxID=67384 RepID=UPI00380A9D3F